MRSLLHDYYCLVSIEPLTCCFVGIGVDEPEDVDGAPCAVQIVTPRFMDEQCLAYAEIIERDLQKAEARWC